MEKHQVNILYLKLFIYFKGIGLRSKDKRIWISHNGVFLNETAPSEKKLTEKEKEKKQKELSMLDPEVGSVILLFCY